MRGRESERVANRSIALAARTRLQTDWRPCVMHDSRGAAAHPRVIAYGSHTLDDGFAFGGQRAVQECRFHSPRLVTSLDTLSHTAIRSRNSVNPLPRFDTQTTRTGDSCSRFRIRPTDCASVDVMSHPRRESPRGAVEGTQQRPDGWGAYRYTYLDLSTKL